MTVHSEANITHSKREHTKPLFYALVVFVKKSVNQKRYYLNKNGITRG